MDLIFQLNNTRFGRTCAPIQEVDYLSHSVIECLFGAVCLLVLSIVRLFEMRTHPVALCGLDLTMYVEGQVGLKLTELFLPRLLHMALCPADG